MGLLTWFKQIWEESQIADTPPARTYPKYDFEIIMFKRYTDISYGMSHPSTRFSAVCKNTNKYVKGHFWGDDEITKEQVLRLLNATGKVPNMH